MFQVGEIRETLWSYSQDYSGYLGITSTDAVKIAILAVLVFPLIYVSYHVTHRIRRLRRIGQRVDKLPGEPKHWLYGNLHQHPGPNEASLFWHNDLTKRYKTLNRFWYGPVRPVVVCTHPDTVKTILRTAEPKTDEGYGGYSLLKPWLGYGLLLSRGQLWARNRRLLTPAFHFDVLKPYMNVYNEAANTFLENLHTASESGESVEVFQPVSLCTLRIILRCAFSYEEDVQKQGMNNPYVRSVLEMAKEIVKRNFSIMAYMDSVYYQTAAGKSFKSQCDFTHKVAYDLINKRKQALLANPEDQKKRYLDFLDILLLARDDNGEGLTDVEIRQEVDTFLFEGHDTTASAISWCLHALAGHPEYQAKAREEVERILAGRDSRDIQWDDLAEMNYLTMCIKESMRLVPPVPFIGRELTAPLVLEGVECLAGTYVDINIWSVHHNEHVWGPDHMEYKPDRFLHENIKDMDSHAFIPFSAGPRNCIGQNFAMHEIKVVVAKTLMEFELKLDPNHESVKLPELVMRAENGMRLILTPRK